MNHLDRGRLNPAPVYPPPPPSPRHMNPTSTTSTSTSPTVKRTAFLMDILRSADGTDCSCNGVSSRHERIFAVTDGELFTEPGPFDPDDPRNPYPVFTVGKAGGRFHLRPESEGTAWLMFGGNFAYSCDSRTPSHPVHIHDRNEARQA